MTHVEIIRLVCSATPDQLRAIETILSSIADSPKHVSDSQLEKTYRIKGKNGFAFEVADNFASLKTFKNGKRLATEDCTLRAVTRGYLEILITNAGRFVKRSSIEKHIQAFDAQENVKKFSGRTSIRDVFRYTLRDKKGTAKYVTLSIYDSIQSINGWDPEYCIPAESVTVLDSRKTIISTYPE